MDIILLNSKNAEKYLTQISELHKEAYSKEHFTASFSIKMLCEYYQLLIYYSDISLVAADGLSVVGFLISGVNVRKGVSAFTRKNWVYICAKLLIRPSQLIEKIMIWIAVRLHIKKKFETAYRLVSLAVRSDTKSKGIAAQLIGSLESMLLLLKISNYGISVRKNNMRAINFYKKLNFVQEDEFHNALYFSKSIE